MNSNAPATVASSGLLDDAIRDKALELAYYLIECGVPVFCAEPRSPEKVAEGESEFDFPRGWQKMRASRMHLKRYKPGWAVCAVTGVLFDVIDVDPRNGGVESYEAIRAAGLLPPVFGKIFTPSGGVHLYVARSGLHKGSPAQGIDLQAGGDDEEPFSKGRGFVYITPTLRPSKVDGQTRLYTEAQQVDLDGIDQGADDPNFTPWLEFVTARLGAPVERRKDPVWRRDTPHDQRERRYLERLMQGVADEMASTPEGFRNDMLNKKAFYVGQVIAGCGLPEQWAKQVLHMAARATGLTDRDIRYRLKRSIGQGKQAPLAVGPFAPGEKERAIEAAQQRQDAEEYVSSYDKIIDEFMATHAGGGGTGDQ